MGVFFRLFFRFIQHNRLAVKEESNVIHAKNQYEEIGNALTSRERPYMSSLDCRVIKIGMYGG
jgi:hypothetical protein